MLTEFPGSGMDRETPIRYLRVYHIKILKFAYFLKFAYLYRNFL